MSNAKNFKELPLGGESFSQLIRTGKYYVDKTSFLKTVFAEDSSSVLLFTRPRRFGKTLLMHMFADFLQINRQDPANIDFQKELFRSTVIIKDKNFVDNFMGKFPVIFLSLKSVSGDDFDEAYAMLAESLATLGKSFAYLRESPKLLPEDKLLLGNLCNQYFLEDRKNRSTLVSALKTLSRCLYQHFNHQIILLIDEYDVPLAKAADKGYHEKMVTLMSSFFDVLKITPGNTENNVPTIFKIVMTGCLKVAKNSIFIGVNNTITNTVLDTQVQFSSIIGFNKDETVKLLNDYGLTKYLPLVKNNYDGYKFFHDDIFCPWDVLNFVAKNYRHVINHTEQYIKAENFWNNSTASNALKGYVNYLSSNVNAQLQDLVDGKNIEVEVNDSMNYDDLRWHHPEDFFSLLIHTGYLTCLGFTADGKYLLKIPNKEILECFKKNIQDNFDNTVLSGNENKAVKIAKAFLNGDTETAENELSRLLQSYISVRDLASRSKKENLYQVFLSGILANCGTFISEYRSNAEAGDGYLDFSFKDQNGKLASVIEIKYCQKSAQMEDEMSKALIQITSKRYAQNLIDDLSVKSVLAYALVFSGKYCRIKKQKLK